MSPQDEFRVIIRNSAICMNCGDEIVSVGRHDSVWCSCGSIMVDGGTVYLRRSGEGEHFHDTSILAKDEPRDHKLENSETVLHNVHHSAKCEGSPCPIHNRSDHHLRSWEQDFDQATGTVHRVCEHGICHVDPDDPFYSPDYRTDDRECTPWCDFCCKEVSS